MHCLEAYIKYPAQLPPEYIPNTLLPQERCVSNGLFLLQTLPSRRVSISNVALSLVRHPATAQDRAVVQMEASQISLPDNLGSEALAMFDGLLSRRKLFYAESRGEVVHHNGFQVRGRLLRPIVFHRDV